MQITPEGDPIPREKGGSPPKSPPTGPAEPENLQAAAQAERSSKGPASQRGRIGQATRVPDPRSRVFPTTTALTSRFPSLLPAQKTVLAVGRRPGGQDGEGPSARPAQTAADEDPVVGFIVGLFAPLAMADDGMLATFRAVSRKQCQGKSLHPGSSGSDLSCTAGSAIKRITAGVKARR
jgi:hypothetical protein